MQQGLNDDGYQHRKHNKNLLLVHLIFVTKYRKKILSGEISKDIMQYIYDACRKHHWYIRTMQTDNDHIHILLQYNPTDNIAQIVSALKQCSTYYIWKKHHDFLSKHFWKERTFWSDGYFACSVGNASKETVEHYIENQG